MATEKDRCKLNNIDNIVAGIISLFRILTIFVLHGHLLRYVRRLFFNAVIIRRLCCKANYFARHDRGTKSGETSFPRRDIPVDSLLEIFKH